MSVYKFRGNFITGVHAWKLLQALKVVMEEIPDPTPQDMEELKTIAEDFEKKFIYDLQEVIRDESGQD